MKKGKTIEAFLKENEQKELLKAFNESMGGKNPDDGKKKKFFGK